LINSLQNTFKIGNLSLPRPAIMLAPLEDITDLPYRLICKAHGADMVFTEFISSDGLIRDAQKSQAKLKIHENERPVGIQIFGNDEAAMVRATELATLAGPDSIDINWGCPVRKVAGKGAGSGILKDIPRMVAITAAVVRATTLPVTVKTRLGYDESDKPIREITRRLQDVGIAAITIHGRTRSQLYSGRADWTLIGEVKADPSVTIPVIGNGDITSPETAKEMLARFGVDGIMIGRGAIGNPWIFYDIKSYLATGTFPGPPPINSRIPVILQHLHDSVTLKGEKRAVLEMRKFYSGYLRGFAGAKALRAGLMASSGADTVENILLDFARQEA